MTRAQSFSGENFSAEFFSATPKVQVFDVVEHEDKIRLVAEAPGMRPDEVRIELLGGVLTVSGSHEEARYVEDRGLDGRCILPRSEHTSYQFSCAFRLPDTINPDGITAGLDMGELTINLAKMPKLHNPEATSQSLHYDAASSGY
eukprot:gene23820-9384_t